MQTSNLPEDTSTLEEFIEAGHKNTLSFSDFSFKDRLSNGTVISTLNVIDDYMDELLNLSSVVRLTQEQYNKYRFKPKLLCHDVYGNPELYYIILRLNGLADMKEFDYMQFRMLKVDYMNRFLSSVYNAEKSYINDYNSRKGTE